MATNWHTVHLSLQLMHTVLLIYTQVVYKLMTIMSGYALIKVSLIVK